MAKSRRFGEKPVSYTADEAQSEKPVRIRRAEVGVVNSTLAGINSVQSGRKTLSNAERRRAARQQTAPTMESRSSRTDTEDSTASTTDGSTLETLQQPSASKPTGRKTPPRKAASSASTTKDDDKSTEDSTKDDGKARVRSLEFEDF